MATTTSGRGAVGDSRRGALLRRRLQELDRMSERLVAGVVARGTRRLATETKTAFKTTEFFPFSRGLAKSGTADPYDDERDNETNGRL